MRLLFAGTPDIAVPTLRAVADAFPVVGVLTAPDRVAGRGRKVTPPPVKTTAEELGLTVLQPHKLDEDARGAVRSLAPDMLVVFAYGKIFGPKFMGLFLEGGVNVHPSLLPKYRGPAPIPAAILAGEAETGITVQYISQKMDAGAIVARERITLEGTETAASLSDDVAGRAGPLLVSTLHRIEAGTAAPEPQDEAAASYCSLINKSDAAIDWEQPADRIERMVRAYHPWPGAYTFWGGRKLTIREAGVSGAQGEGKQPGRVLGVDRERGILIQTGNGVLGVRRLQIQAGQESDWKSFINGHRDLDGAVLGG